MKLQNLSNIALPQQEMTSVKGGKRVFCIQPDLQKLLDKAATVKPPKTITTTFTSKPFNKDVLIQWKNTPCKKP